MMANPIDISESCIPRDWQGCATADRVYLKDLGAWLELDSWDHRSKGFNSLRVKQAWDFYGEEASSHLVFDEKDRHIGAAWVECALASHPSGTDYVLVRLNFRTDIPWVKCPENLDVTFAIKVSDFYPDYFAVEIAEMFSDRLIDNSRDCLERGLTES